MISRLRGLPIHYVFGLAGVAALGVAHILVRTSAFGVALNADGVLYLSTAESLIAGDGLRTYSDGPFLLWPPLYPLLLASIGVFGADVAEAGRLLNATALGAIAFLAALWLGTELRHRALAFGAAASIVVSLPLCHVSSYLITEPLFCLFILLALMYLHSFLKRDSGKAALLLSIVFAGCAAATRYIGGIVIIVGVLMLLFRRSQPHSTKVRQATVYGALASIPVALAMVRNWAVAGRPLGARAGDASGYSPLDSLVQLVDAVYVGLLPAAAPVWVGTLVLAGIGLTAVGAVVVWLSAKRPVAANQHPRGVAAAYPCAVFAAAYLGVLVLLSGATTGEIVSPRYIAPAFAPLVVVAVFLLDRFMALEARPGFVVIKRAVTALALAGWLANLGWAAFANVQLTGRALASGYHGYTTVAWQESATISHLQANPISGRLYSNEPAAVYYLATAPRRVKYIPNVKTAEECHAWLQRVGEAGGAHVVWFRTRPRWTHDEVVSRDTAKWTGAWRNARRRCDIGALPTAKAAKVAELSDGTIYRVAAANASMRPAP